MPLSFIFSPLATLRALAALVGAVGVWVEGCPKANGERASVSPKASAIDRSIRVVINSLLMCLVAGARSPDPRRRSFEFDDELLIQVVREMPQTVSKIVGLMSSRLALINLT
jgi:hypothetical protein